jgi:hypothetical protein
MTHRSTQPARTVQRAQRFQAGRNIMSTMLHSMSGLVLAVGAVVASAGSAMLLTPRADTADVQIIAPAAELAAVHRFERSVSEYVALHRSLEVRVPPLQVSEDMRTIYAAMDALAKEIRTARPDARQGDLFSDEVARMFRARIATCVTTDEMKTIRAEQKEDDPVPLPPLVVNMRWPAGVPFIFVPPRLIATLPPLPAELQYRIIGHSIVLWDHHADLIIDVLPEAFTT